MRDNSRAHRLDLFEGLLAVALFAMAGAAIYLMTWLPGVLTGLLTLWWLLRIVGGRVESTVLAAGLRRVGWVLVLGSLTAYVLASLARSVLAYLVFTGDGLFAPSAFSVVALLAGVSALAVAEFVGRGAGSGLAERRDQRGDQWGDQERGQQVADRQLLHPQQPQRDTDQQ
ncbi:hypothetical protein [Flindersiella endophytica]